MKKIIVLLIAAAVCIPAMAQKDKKSKSDKTDKIVLKNFEDSVTYALAVFTAKSMHDQNFDSVNTDLYAKAFEAYYTGKLKDSSLQCGGMSEMQNILSSYGSKRTQAEANANMEQGKVFLEKNKTAPGVVALPSGLQYKVVTQGTGKKPGPTDNVTVHYKGTLIDGRIFDSSYDRGEPISFPLNGVIRGWTEGLQLMGEGSKYILFIPPQLAYGPGGAPGSIIGPNATLVFEVELIKVGQ